MSNYVSPNDLQQAAIDMMLDGKEPRTNADWNVCANFWAANVHYGHEHAVLPLLAKVLDCPLTEKHLQNIATFQLARKNKET